MKDPCCESPCRATQSASTAEPLPLSAARLACLLVAELARFVRASDQNFGHLTEARSPVAFQGCGVPASHFLLHWQQ